MLEPPTGWQFVLERPGQRAVVSEVGAGLRSWRTAGAERLAGDDHGKVHDPAGLLPWVNWRPVRRTPDRVALAYVLHPQPAFPFTVGVEVEYALDCSGVAVMLCVVNLGESPVEFGAAFRPRVAGGGECSAPARDGDGRVRVQAGDVSAWTDFGSLSAEMCGEGVELALDAPLELAAGERFVGRWGLASELLAG
jgi:hypothetical protein